MLDHISADIEFSQNINRLAKSAEVIAQSLAIIAGVVSKREGLNFINPANTMTQQPHNNSPKSSMDELFSSKIPQTDAAQDFSDSLIDTE